MVAIRTRYADYFLSACLVLHCVGCTDRPNEDVVREVVGARIDNGISSRLKLSSFSKTDGVRSEVSGVKAYTMMFKASVEFSDDAYYTTGGSMVEPDVVIVTRPATNAPRTCSQDLTACLSQGPMFASKGERFDVTGSATLQRTEAGWHVTGLALNLPDCSRLPGCAHERAERSGVRSDPATSAYISAMKSDLRNLVTAEESFFADSTKYTANGSGQLKFRPSDGVSHPVIVPGSGYWAATVTHLQIPGIRCGIGVNTANPLLASAGDGEPVCK